AMAGPWHALGWQLGAVLLVTLLGAAAFGANVARSVAYGGAAALVPSAVMALAMRGALMRAAQGHAAMSLMTLLAFEMLKVALAVALLFAAPVWLGSVVWPALLVGLVVGLKAHLMAMAFGPSGPRNPRPSQYPDKCLGCRLGVIPDVLQFAFFQHPDPPFPWHLSKAPALALT
ncbi:MAG: ATP synthase subunit I, partial [Burkholderiaceae bacterium]